MAKPKKTAPPPPSDFGDIAEAFANPTRPRTRTKAKPEAAPEPAAEPAAVLAAQEVVQEPQEASQEAPEPVPAHQPAAQPAVPRKAARGPQKPARGRGRPKAAREVKNITYSVGVDQALRLDRIAAAEWMRTGQKTSPSEILRVLLDRALEQLGDSTEVLR